MIRILAVNPGGTSTKIGVFDDDQVCLQKTVEHQGTELSKFNHVLDQLQFRVDIITKVLEEAGIPLNTLDAIVGRGGLLKPDVDFVSTFLLERPECDFLKDYRGYNITA